MNKYYSINKKLVSKSDGSEETTLIDDLEDSTNTLHHYLLSSRNKRLRQTIHTNEIPGSSGYQKMQVSYDNYYL